jgi:hypothetical protein
MPKKSKSWNVIEYGGSEFASFEEAISNGMDILINVICSDNDVEANGKNTLGLSNPIPQKKDAALRVKEQLRNSAHSAG